VLRNKLTSAMSIVCGSQKS